jgi:hypothetical protein
MSCRQAARIEQLAETVAAQFRLVENINHRYPPENGLGGHPARVYSEHNGPETVVKKIKSMMKRVFL